MFTIPLTALVVFNTCLVRNLNKSIKLRQQLNHTPFKSVHNIAITLNLVIIITKFIICETPDFIAAVLGIWDEIRSKTEYKYFSTVKEMLLVFNSSVNFYIYLLFNTKFRGTLKQMCCYRDNICPNTNWYVSDTENAKSDHIVALTHFKTKL